MGRSRGRAASSKEKYEDGAEVVREARRLYEHHIPMSTC